ncbi:MAG: hypothetical protein FD172_3916 [Methylocystaceae bacterium]|nr:MAG: hypothetical protein FD172_3916 [Methylocystaceae bacterium]
MLLSRVAEEIKTVVLPWLSTGDSIKRLRNKEIQQTEFTLRSILAYDLEQQNQIRPLTLTRKNALFAGHDEGGRSWARIASLIATCKINGAEPYVWMKATLEAIVAGHPQSRIDELMPWAFGRTL